VRVRQRQPNRTEASKRGVKHKGPYNTQQQQQHQQQQSAKSNGKKKESTSLYGAVKFCFLVCVRFRSWDGLFIVSKSAMLAYLPALPCALLLIDCVP
jgi:hypothetical protein